MYRWLEDLIAAGGDAVRRAELAPGATSDAILALERDLGVPMPPSWRAFVARWDGGELFGYPIHSVDGIREWHKKNGAFRPWTGAAEPFDPTTDEYYSARPAHHLVFAEAYDGEVFTMDTRPAPPGEYGIAKYDAHEAEDAHRVRFPSFETWLVRQALDRLGRSPEYGSLLAMLQVRGWSGDELGYWAGGELWHR